MRLLLHAYSRKEAVARAMMQWDVALGRKHAQSLLEQFTAYSTEAAKAQV